ncbi:FtsX-like permease family protein [Rhizobium ruizarguesonis]
MLNLIDISKTCEAGNGLVVMHNVDLHVVAGTFYALTGPSGSGKATLMNLIGSIARALIGGPSLLVADEPTGNLDSRTGDEIMTLFLKLNAELGLTVIIVTHSPTIAARCPPRIVMRDGQGYFAKHMSAGTMQVATAREMIASIEAQMKIYATLILGIGAVSLVVGGVGIMNVMLMSVMERRQEIGLLLAIGARRKDIRLMFLSETLVLSTIGSAVGVVIGYLAGWVFADSSGWQFEAAPMALPLGAGMTLVVGLFFGIYPASRAARLDPLAALRSE